MTATLDAPPIKRARTKREKPPVRLVHVQRFDGPSSLVALSRSDESKGYELRTDHRGLWKCPCTGHDIRQTCSHTQAADALAPLPAAPSSDRELVLDDLP